jgi:hypothetical protein
MEKLYLQNNKLETLGLRSQGSSPATTIPPPLSYLKFLRVLRVDGNKLSNLDGIGSLLSLEELDASHNEIRSLKALKGTSGVGMKNLTSLNLSNNLLTGDLSGSDSTSEKSSTGGGAGGGGSGMSSSSSSSSFFAEFLPTLKDLNVSRNKLTSLTGLKGSESITLINASNNAISSPSFMNSLGTLPNLLELSVSSNQISSLPSLSSTTAAAFPALEVLDISGNTISASDMSISVSISSLSVFAKACPNLLELVTLGNPFIQDLQAEIDQGDVLSISSSISEKLNSVFPSLELYNKKAITGTSSTSTLSIMMSGTEDSSSSISISSMALPTLSVEKFSLENNAGSVIGAAFAEANNLGGSSLRRPGSASKTSAGTTPMLMRPSSAGGIRPGSASIQRPRSNGGTASSTPAASNGTGGLHLKSVVSREDIEAQLKSTMETLARTRKNAAKRSAAAIEAAKGLSGALDGSDAASAPGGPRGLRQALKYARDDSSEVTKVETNTTPCLIIEGGGSVQNRYLAAAALRKKKALGLEEEKSEVTSLTDFNNKFGTTSASQSMIISSSDVKSNELANINSTGPASGYGTEEEAKVAEDGNVDDDEEEEEDDEDTERKEKDEVLAKLEAQTVETLTAALNSHEANKPSSMVSKPLTAQTSTSIDSSRPTLKKSSTTKAPVSLSLSTFSRAITTSSESSILPSSSFSVTPSVIQTSTAEVISETPSELDLSGGSGGSNHSVTPSNPHAENSSEGIVISNASPAKILSIKPSRPLSAVGASKLRVGDSLGALQQRDLLTRQPSALTASTKGAAGKMSDESIKRSLAAIQ